MIVLAELYAHHHNTTKGTSMNTLGITKDFNKFTGEHYPVFTVDDIPLHTILDRAIPGQKYWGVVPTLLHWLNNEPEEQRVVWERIVPEVDQTLNSPILNCSECCDLSCSVIIAENTRDSNSFKWTRLGLDRSCCEADDVGSEVEWFDDLSFEFSAENYLEVISYFKEHLENPRIREYSKPTIEKTQPTSGGYDNFRPNLVKKLWWEFWNRD